MIRFLATACELNNEVESDNPEPADWVGLRTGESSLPTYFSKHTKRTSPVSAKNITKLLSIELKEKNLTY